LIQVLADPLSAGGAPLRCPHGHQEQGDKPQTIGYALTD